MIFVYIVYQLSKHQIKQRLGVMVTKINNRVKICQICNLEIHIYDAILKMMQTQLKSPLEIANSRVNKETNLARNMQFRAT
jgi:hypothetical protein